MGWRECALRVCEMETIGWGWSVKAWGLEAWGAEC